MISHNHLLVPTTQTRRIIHAITTISQNMYISINSINMMINLNPQANNHGLHIGVQFLDYRIYPSQHIFQHHGVQILNFACYDNPLNTHFQKIIPYSMTLSINRIDTTLFMHRHMYSLLMLLTYFSYVVANMQNTLVKLNPI